MSEASGGRPADVARAGQRARSSWDRKWDMEQQSGVTDASFGAYHGIAVDAIERAQRAESALRGRVRTQRGVRTRPCDACRIRKVKCVVLTGHSKCTRCTEHKRDCDLPDGDTGRLFDACRIRKEGEMRSTHWPQQVHEMHRAQTRLHLGTSKQGATAKGARDRRSGQRSRSRMRQRRATRSASRTPSSMPTVTLRSIR